MRNKDAADLLYKNLYYLGLQSGRWIKRFAAWLGALLKKPYQAFKMLVLAVLLAVDRFALKGVHTVAEEARALYADFDRVFSKLGYVLKHDRKNAGELLRHYFKTAFQKHGAVFTFTVNLLVPIAALALLAGVIGYWSDTTPALEIKYNNSVIGYVTSESVYHDAQSQASERLQTAKSVDASGTMLKSPEYSLTMVDKADLSDASAICDKLIENSETKITNACGIYINGSFLCAVKNETDAISVFDSILSAYQTGDGNSTPSFVEKIEYVQGLYPENSETMWDTEKLAAKLKTKKTEAVYYTVQLGDAPSSVAQKFGISTAQLYALNPQIGANIHVGEQLKVSSEVDFIRVQITRTEKRHIAIPYEIIETKSPSLYTGTKRVTQKGAEGTAEITELVTYISGTRVSAREVGRITVKNPVTQKVQVGTKKPSSGSGSNVSGPIKDYGGKFIWPAVNAYSISSYYGRRSMGFHKGIDIVKPGGHSTGCPVVAADGGRVVTAGYHSSFGYHVIIDHGGGFQTLYAHMLKGSLKVRVGQRVSQGQVIGNIGSTGNVTGPHLHFEVRVNGNRVNPLPYLGRKK